MKKGDVVMAKHFSKRGELSVTLYLQSEINFCFVRMPVNACCYIPTSLPLKQVARIKFFQLWGSSKMSI